MLAHVTSHRGPILQPSPSVENGPPACVYAVTLVWPWPWLHDLDTESRRRYYQDAGAQQM